MRSPISSITSVRPSVRQSTYINTSCTDRSAVKFAIGDLYENLSTNSRFVTIGKAGQCT